MYLIYCIGLPWSRVNNIGYVEKKANLKVRLRVLQAGNPKTLKIKWVMPSSTKDQVIHNQLERAGIKRTRHKSEWFDIGADRIDCRYAGETGKRDDVNVVAVDDRDRDRDDEPE